jgi:hypothetical protein
MSSSAKDTHVRRNRTLVIHTLQWTGFYDALTKRPPTECPSDILTQKHCILWHFVPCDNVPVTFPHILSQCPRILRPPLIRCDCILSLMVT